MSSKHFVGDLTTSMAGNTRVYVTHSAFGVRGFMRQKRSRAHLSTANEARVSFELARPLGDKPL